MATIGIDARFYGPLGKGLGRYIKEVTDRLIKLDQDNDYVVFLNAENFDEFKSDNKKVKKVLLNIGWYGFKEQIILPMIIKKNNIDLMLFPHFNVPMFCACPFIVTIHDLILTKFPTARATTLGPIKYWLKNLAYHLVISRAVSRAKKILAVSEFTKNDLVQQFKVKPEKIVVTYEGSADVFQQQAITNNDVQRVLNNYKISDRFLLYVGNAYPHKNLETLLAVFKNILIDDKKLKLVLVGKEDFFYNRLKEQARRLELWQTNNDDPLIFTGYVSDADLAVLYQSARAYVFPSLYEGFGLPALEAMSQGCPVISSNVASMPEILGSAAWYFNPRDQYDMRDKIMVLINDDNLRQDLINKGYEQVKKYSWQTCARLVLDIIKNCLS